MITNGIAAVARGDGAKVGRDEKSKADPWPELVIASL